MSPIRYADKQGAGDKDRKKGKRRIVEGRGVVVFVTRNNAARRGTSDDERAVFD